MSSYSSACRILSLSFLCATIWLTGSFSPLHAQLPATRLSSLFPAGANPGATLEVTIHGADLDDVQELTFSHPGITAKQKMAEPGPFEKAAQPVENVFVVSVAANVPRGLYEARAAGKYGVSNSRLFSIDTLPEALEAEPNNDAETATELTIPVVVNGQSNPARDVDFYKFTAQSGQRVLVDCQARRIDSRMDPVVTVIDPNGRELGTSRNTHRRDPLVDFTAAASGEYFIRVVDSVYRGDGDYFYRLSVGVLPHIDFVFPPSGQAGGNRAFTVYGRNLPGGQPAGVSIDDKPLQKLAVNIPVPADAPARSDGMALRLDPEQGGLKLIEYRVAAGNAASNVALVGIAPTPVIVEQEPNQGGSIQKLTPPCEVAGQFYPREDVDWFEFDAQQGDVLNIELISQRIGLPTDPSILIQQVTLVKKQAEDGTEVEEESLKPIATADDSGDRDSSPEFDTRTDDPEYLFTAPADGTYRILVRDGYSSLRSDPRNVYRLAIRKPIPDFRLAAAPGVSDGGLYLRKGGHAPIRVVAYRQDGYQGEIQVSVTGLPAGVTCAGGVIGPERSSTTIILSAAANAAPATGLVQIVGKGVVGSADVTRTALFGTPVWPSTLVQPNQPSISTDARMSNSLAVSVSPEVDPLSISIGEGKVYETSRGGILKIPFKSDGAVKNNITMIGFGLPANVTFNNNNQPVAVNGAAGTFDLKMNANTPTGAYTFVLSGMAQQVDYARNPEAAKAAADRKVTVDAIHANAQADATAATAAKAAADKLATDTAAAAKIASDQKAAAEQALTVATEAAKTAADQAAQAKAAAVASPDNKALADAATAAQKLSDDATAKVKAATDALAAAQKALDDADAKAKAATDEKTVIDEKHAAAVELAKAAAELKARTDKQATDTANAAKPQKRNVGVVSTPVTINIAPAPITLTATSPAAALMQNSKVDVPVSIARLYGFNQAVTISGLPQGVGGLSIPNASIANGQTQTNLAITAASNATEGTHQLIVRATFQWNGVNLTVDQPITLKIEKPAPVSN